MIVECPACNTIFPVDPKKVPTGGIDARCSVCSEVFFVAPPVPEVEVLEPVVESIETEVEVSEPFTAEPASEVPIEDPVEALPDEVVGVDVAATAVEEVVTEAEAEPAFDEEMPSVVDTEFDAVSEGVVEAEPETNLVVEAEPSFEIEREPSFEEQEFSFGAEAEPNEVEGLDPGFVPESTFEPEPVFESVEATFEKVEEDVVDSGEQLQEEAAGMAGDFSTAMEAETVEVVEEVTETVEEIPEGPTISAPVFGKRDPMEKAQRLARVLVSDIILYNPDRHHTATETGRVKDEFEEEIQKSWSEYVEQVGDEIATTTPFFNNALNEILAKGEKIF